MKKKHNYKNFDTDRGSKATKAKNHDFVKSVLHGLEQPTILWGRHAVTAAIANPLRKVYHIFCSKNNLTSLETYISEQQNIELNPSKGVEVLTIDDLNSLAPPDAVHQGFIIIARTLKEENFDEFLDAQKTKQRLTLVVLDQVTDPHNVGAIARSAAALGADGMVLQSRNAPRVEGVLAKSASGATEHLPIFRVTNIARALRQMQTINISCFGLAGESDNSITEFPLTDRVALVLGAEGPGLRRLTREICDGLIRLPTEDHFSTLNVSNAASIALYEVRRRAQQGRIIS